MRFSRPILLLIGLLPFLVAGAGRDAYKILNVGRGASARAIKKAFRAASKKWHPDRHQEDKAKAEEKFKDIAWAYETLSNETTRKIYDAHGEEGLKQQEMGGGGPRFNPFGSGTFGGFKQGGFQTTFGNGFPGGEFVFHGGFPGGGFPGGGFPGGGFPGGGFPGGQGAVFSAVDWFEDGPVELIGERLETEDIHEVWPDVFFMFSDDTERTELVARALVSVAESLRSIVEVQALDCRKPKQLCKTLHLTQGPYELQLLNSADLEAPMKRKKHLLEASRDLDAELIMDWLITDLPMVAKTLTSISTFERFVRDNTKGDLPVVALIDDEAMPHPATKKLMAENSKRIKFGYVPKTKASAKLRNTLQTLFKDALGPKDVPPYFVHIPDMDVIGKDTIEVISANENEVALDLTVAKWVGMKRTQQGVYQKASRSLRRLTTAMQKSGICSPEDSKYCLVYLAKRNSLSAEEIRILSSLGTSDAVRLLWVNGVQQSILSYAFGAPPGSLVMFRPKRRKFLVMEGELTARNAAEFVESVLDGSALLQRGKVLKLMPELAVSE